MIDVTFINGLRHRRLVENIIHEMTQDVEVVGLFLQGSVARGDCYHTSDLDLYAVLKDGLHRPFRSEYRDGVLVEIKYADFEKASEKCKVAPMGMYNFLDSIILLDRQGRLKQLKMLAQCLLDQYQTPKTVLNSISHWLESSLIKIRASKEAHDDLKASFVVSTTSWQIIEGIWALNNRPVPPNGSVLYHLRDLTILPENMNRQIQCLFAGDVKERINAAIDVIEWSLAGLNKLASKS